MSIKYSIIIPIYNVEKYISQCIDSILNVEYKNIEIILVNDGSTDKSQVICENYAKKDTRIKVINKSNEGVSAARNTGIQASDGDYIMFLDSDDYILYDIFTNMHKALIDKKTDIVIYNYRYENSLNGEVFKSKIDYNGVENVVYTGERSLEILIDKYTLFDWYPWQFLIKKEFLLENHIEFKEGVLYEDVEVIPSMIINAQTVIFNNAEVINYRIKRNGSITNSITLKTEMDRLSVAKSNIDKINLSTLSNELKHKLNNNFGCMYFTCIINYFYLSKQDKKILKNELKRNNYIGKYVYNKKQKYTYNLYRLVGINVTSFILYIRTQIKKG